MIKYVHSFGVTIRSPTLSIRPNQVTITSFGPTRVINYCFCTNEEGRGLKNYFKIDTPARCVDNTRMIPLSVLLCVIFFTCSVWCDLKLSYVYPKDATGTVTSKDMGEEWIDIDHVPSGTHLDVTMNWDGVRVSGSESIVCFVEQNDRSTHKVPCAGPFRVPPGREFAIRIPKEKGASSPEPIPKAHRLLSRTLKEVLEWDDADVHHHYIVLKYERRTTRPALSPRARPGLITADHNRRPARETPPTGSDFIGGHPIGSKIPLDEAEEDFMDGVDNDSLLESAIQQLPYLLGFCALQ